MKNKEILEQAIRKAVDNGWQNEHITEGFSDGEKGYPAWTKDDVVRSELSITYEAGWSGLIFNHDFAKAIWGDIEARYYVEYVSGKDAQWLEEYLDGAWVTTSKWRWHLQQMVIVEDPIAYLGEHI